MEGQNAAARFQSRPRIVQRSWKLSDAVPYAVQSLGLSLLNYHQSHSWTRKLYSPSGDGVGGRASLHASRSVGRYALPGPGKRQYVSTSRDVLRSLHRRWNDCPLQLACLRTMTFRDSCLPQIHFTLFLCCSKRTALARTAHAGPES